MTLSLGSFLDNAAPPLAWQFRTVGDRHHGIIESVEIRQGVDSDREPLTDENGAPVMLPVFAVIDTDTGEVRSLYGKPALMSALVTGLKRARIAVGAFETNPAGFEIDVILSSLGEPSKASWSPPQRFTVTVVEHGGSEDTDA